MNEVSLPIAGKHGVDEAVNILQVMATFGAGSGKLGEKMLGGNSITLLTDSNAWML